MGRLNVNGIDDTIIPMEKLAGLPERVIDDMLTAMADIVQPQIKTNAQTMLRGPYYAGGVAGSLKRNPIKTQDGRRTLYVTFEGKQHGERLATIAFVNEYGKKKQPARPFIRTAIEQKRSEATEAAAAVLFDYEQECGL